MNVPPVLRVPRVCYCSVSIYLIVATGLPTPAVAAEQQNRPNVIAIVTDDQARWAMGLYGNDEIHTPHMDRIGREGALFTNAFVATPVCSPSRATYLTGRWPTQLRITDWISPLEANRGLGLHGVTWPQVLKQHGYRTALVGKWHLGEQAEFHPQRLGFSHFMGFLSGGNRPMDPILEVDGKDVKMKGPLPDLLADDAIRFIRANRDQPFALCLHFRAPHLPYGPVPETDSAPYVDLDPTVPTPRGGVVAQIKKWHRDYYASISSVDRNIGRLLDELEALGLVENTLVLFTSDHGYNNGRHGVETKGNASWIAGGVRGPKRPNMWDTSIRVPLVVRWPAVIQPGSQYEQMVSHLDIFRTMLGALSLPVPDEAAPHGRDFSPLFRGESAKQREYLFGQYDLHNSGLAYMRMVRTKQFKFVRHFKANFMDELYDLEKDPGETHNLASRNRAKQWQHVLKPLRERLTAWQRSIGDPILRSSY